MTIKELHKVLYPAINIAIFKSNGSWIKLDREDPLLMESFGDVVIDVLGLDNEGSIDYITVTPKMQLVREKEDKTQ